ncbi:uncharacterized protein MELLADRAFT_85780 [Melampsora larici-populina 98AG31]|uniref:Uncharacterized protein n=1 Tax=Melampsora larici-populina (strain 98AG31 / pathotype 3-4-7) TaxID=747676 RepID=F4RJR3_MELLP|nr:uncharacterized protein MELLADRAFT_85780 [Melampsora larici-populina 98AG31]EGG07451.1 hypothetical protein MELLADRAFT_85780 [Melampsora larici-populina 98AG31]
MPFNLPSNFSANPESFLRRQRPSEPAESPPAPAPPRYNWKPQADHDYTPDKTIRTILPSSSHSLAEPTNTPDVQIVRESLTTLTPIVPGSFIYTPMPASRGGSSDADTVKGKDPEERRSKDEIIEALHERMRQLEEENAAFQSQAAAATADRQRLDALEATISQLVKSQSPGTGNSGGSQNPFGLLASHQDNLNTPTPLGPRASQFNDAAEDHRPITGPVSASRPRPAPLERGDEAHPAIR